MWAMRSVCRTLVGSKGRVHSENLGVGGMIILKWTLGKYDWRMCIGFIWLRVRDLGRAL
jgi:hypothetical protein